MCVCVCVCVCVCNRGEGGREREGERERGVILRISLNLFCHLLSRGSQQQCHAHAETSGNCDLYEAELDIRKEKRNQKYLISMVTIFAICLCPLMVLRYVS